MPSPKTGTLDQTGALGQTGTSTKTGRLLRAAVFGLLAFVAACGGPQVVRLNVAGNVADATVTVDDVLLGSLSYVQRHGVALPPGKHRITVEKAGYFPWDRLIEATDQPIKLDVQLTRVPD